MKCLFLNDGSGKTLRERDILLYFCNRRNCTTNLFVPGVLPRYVNVFFAGPVYKESYNSINKKRKRKAKIQERRLYGRKKEKYVCIWRGEGIGRILLGPNEGGPGHATDAS